MSPFDGSVFPRDIAPPRFFWKDTTDRVDRWTIRIEFSGGGEPMRFTSDAAEWVPPAAVWQQIKARSLEADAQVTIRGIDRSHPKVTLSEAAVTIRTSQDEVGAPIFYREVNLPFVKAVMDPAAYIRWRFGSVSSLHRPPVVLEKMPLCGNCHSFSRNGSLIGMDVDYGSDKGSYVICPVSQEMVYDNPKIITWSDYKREDNRGTLGLLSQVSPDGRYVISTVKDRSVFAAADDLAFSQLFFPVQGILAYYDRHTATFHALPGADDERYVQTNGTWSPDGKYVVFARSKAYQSPAFRKKRRGLSRPEDVAEFLEGRRPFKFDLWRIPFNNGKGGTPEPLEGASNNGMSNYFPKYSPDGKWIVFCRAKNFMLLQPDSALYIIPAEGGEARRLECNTARMNSWHSWSPNGRWLVFSSKAYSPYTQLFLTHIDEQGRSTPPVVLWNFTSEKMAANIPEFVNTSPDAIRRIRLAFIDDLSYLQTGRWSVNDGEYELAIKAFRKALEINPDNNEARVALGGALLVQGHLEEARSQLSRALSKEPENKQAGCLLGSVLEKQGRFSQALAAYRRVLEVDSHYAAAHQSLGRLLLNLGSMAEGRKHLLEGARLDPDTASPYIDLGNSFLREHEVDQAVAMYRKALEREADSLAALIGLAMALLQTPGRGPQDIAEAVALAEQACHLTNQKSFPALILLADAYAAAGRPQQAGSVAQKALRLAEQMGNPQLARTAHALLEQYQRQPASLQPR